MASAGVFCGSSFVTSVLAFEFALGCFPKRRPSPDGSDSACWGWSRGGQAMGGDDGVCFLKRFCAAIAIESFWRKACEPFLNVSHGSARYLTGVD